MLDSLSGKTNCCACVQNARKHLDLASAASSDSSLSDWDWLKIDKDNEYRLKVCAGSTKCVAYALLHALRCMVLRPTESVAVRTTDKVCRMHQARLGYPSCPGC